MGNHEESGADPQSTAASNLEEKNSSQGFSDAIQSEVGAPVQAKIEALARNAQKKLTDFYHEEVNFDANGVEALHFYLVFREKSNESEKSLLEEFSAFFGICLVKKYGGHWIYYYEPDDQWDDISYYRVRTEKYGKIHPYAIIREYYFSCSIIVPCLPYKLLIQGYWERDYHEKRIFTIQSFFNRLPELFEQECELHHY